MKKLFFAAFSVILLSCFSPTASAQQDSVFIAPQRGLDLCRWIITVKNLNTQSLAIDEITFHVTVADDNVAIYELGHISGWQENISDNFNASYVALSVPASIAAGATKTGFSMAIGLPPTYYDQPVEVKWVAKNSLQGIDSGLINFVCTQFQYYRNDSVSVAASVINNDPVFNFTLYNRNEVPAPLSRFVVKLETPGGGTMRPSQVAPPSGWLLDSVSGLYAYFHSEGGGSNLQSGGALSGFKVVLRGNPTKNKFDFTWYTFDPNNFPISRDTLHNVSVTFTGTASETDVVSAAVQTGCLYTLTVKNYHVSNPAPPSRIRRIALWSKTLGVTFIAAQSAPTGWTKVVKSDSIIYTASADSLGLASSTVSKQFAFNVDAPSPPFKLGWKTFKTLSYADSLSVGELNLQCQKEPPKSDSAFLSVTQQCCYQLQVWNYHNQPPSDLEAIQVSIPPGKGRLTNVLSSLNWDKAIEKDTVVRFTAPVGSSQTTGNQQLILFCLDPTTPGENFPLSWRTYNAAGLSSNTPVVTGAVTIGCTPAVSLCDVVTDTAASTDTCTYNFTFQNKRNNPMNHIVLHVGSGGSSWTVPHAVSPSGWTMQVLGGNTVVDYQAEGEGIPPGVTQNGFIVKFKSDNKADTIFGVAIRRYDPTNKECFDSLVIICSPPKESVRESGLVESSIRVKPNPAHGDATLYFSVEKPGKFIVELLDVLGKRVQLIENASVLAGEYEIPFSMTDLESGNYYLRISTPTGVVTKKLILVR